MSLYFYGIVGRKCGPALGGICGLAQRTIALGFVYGRKRPNSEAIRHKGRVEAYFLLEFLFLLFRDKRNMKSKWNLN
jgi:hypothetical protein